MPLPGLAQRRAVGSSIPRKDAGCGKQEAGTSGLGSLDPCLGGALAVPTRRPPAGLAHLPGSWHTCLVPGTVVPACSQQCCRCHADFKNAGSKCSTGFDLESGMSAPVSKGGRAHGRVDWVAKVIDGNDGRDHPEPTGGWLMGQDFMTDD